MSNITNEIYYVHSSITRLFLGDTPPANPQLYDLPRKLPSLFLATFLKTDWSND